MPIRRFAHFAHRWLGLLLGAQVVLWMASGVIMSWFPIDLVQGETAALTEAAPELGAHGYASPGGIIAQMEGATEVRLKTWMGRQVYEARSDTATALFDANTGARLSPIAEADARRVAEQDFLGDGDLVGIDLLPNPPPEYSGPRPVWRATFDDRDATRLYISAETGAVVSRRNRVWRVYDFFWMLHIMDYGERENFNNPLVRAASVTGLLFALSGVFLIAARASSGGYKIGGFSAQAKHSIKIPTYATLASEHLTEQAKEVLGNEPPAAPPPPLPAG